MGDEHRKRAGRDPAARRQLARRLTTLLAPREVKARGDAAPFRLDIVRELRSMLGAVTDRRQRAVMEAAALVMEMDHARLTQCETPYGSLQPEDAVVLECLRHQGGCFSVPDLVIRYSHLNAQHLRIAIYRISKARPDLVHITNGVIRVAPDVSALVETRVSERRLRPLFPTRVDDDDA